VRRRSPLGSKLVSKICSIMPCSTGLLLMTLSCFYRMLSGAIIRTKGLHARSSNRNIHPNRSTNGGYSHLSGTQHGCGNVLIVLWSNCVEIVGIYVLQASRARACASSPPTYPSILLETKGLNLSFAQVNTASISVLLLIVSFELTVAPNHSCIEIGVCSAWRGVPTS
jgi:hypothetical protein